MKNVATFTVRIAYNTESDLRLILTRLYLLDGVLSATYEEWLTHNERLMNTRDVEDELYYGRLDK